jgi:hypothetical protein
MSNLKIGAKTFCISLKSHKDFNKLCLETCLIDEQSVKFTDGFIDFYNQILYMRDDLHTDVMATCLLSNALQIISADSGIEELSGTPLQSVTQVVVSMLTPRLLQFLRDNQVTLLEYGITNSL